MEPTKVTVYITALMLCFLSGCQEVNKSAELNSIDTEGTIMQNTEQISYSKDSVIIVNGLVFDRQYPELCGDVNTDAKEDATFLNSNICYLKTKTSFGSQFKTEGDYQILLRKSGFLIFEESSFDKGNFTFELKEINIKQYGKCYIGKYYFPTAANSGQARTTVIVNPARKEVSIYNFDDVMVSSNGLNCDFNVRGKHTVYKLRYSLKCKLFVPLESVK